MKAGHLRSTPDVNPGEPKLRNLRGMENVKDERHTQYHCSMYPIIHLFGEIGKFVNAHHRKIMMATPFGHLLTALCEGRVNGLRKKDKCLDQIISTYDKGEKAFKLGNGFHRPTRLDVKLMFGIVDGREEIGHMMLRRDVAYEFGPRMFGKTGKITVAKVKAKAHEYVHNTDPRSQEDTVKLLCLVLMHTFFLPTSAGCMPRGFLQFVDTFETMRRFNWSGKIHEELMHGLADNWTMCSRVNGCTVFLMFWLGEKSKTISEGMRTRRDANVFGFKAIPRVCKWTLREVEKMIDVLDLNREDHIQFNGANLEPTAEEVIMIDGLAVEMVAMDVDTFKNVGEPTIGTDQGVDMSTHRAGKEVVVQDSELVGRQRGDISKIHDLVEDIDWCTPSFSLGLTQELASTHGDMVVEKGEAHGLKVFATLPTRTQQSVLDGKVSEDIDASGRIEHPLQHQTPNKEIMGNINPKETRTPASEYHTPTTLFIDDMEDIMEPNTTRLHATEYDTAVKVKPMMTTFLRPTQPKSRGHETLPFSEMPKQLEGMGREKGMGSGTLHEPERRVIDSSDKFEKLNAQMAVILAEIGKCSTATTSLLSTTSTADKKIGDLELSYGRLEKYVMYLEEKIDLYYDEISKHGCVADGIINKHLGISSSDIGYKQASSDIHKEVEEHRYRVAKLEAQLEEQASVIQKLVHNVGKENRIVNGNEQLEVSTGVGNHTLKVYSRKRDRSCVSSRVLQEKN